MKIADDEPIGRAATGRRNRVCLGRLMTDSNADAYCQAALSLLPAVEMTYRPVASAK